MTGEDMLEKQKQRMYQELFTRREERVITHRDVELLRERIGTEVPLNRPYNEVCTRDGLRKLAQGHGDLNPLYWDEEYGATTRWGGLIAPPTFINTTGTSAKREFDDYERAKGMGAMNGVHAWDGGKECYYYRPVKLGDFLWSTRYLADVQKKASRFAQTAVHSTYRQFWANDSGELVAACNSLVVWAGRERQPGERQKYAHIEGKQRYRPDELMRIDEDMDKEEIRGAEPRYWEDANVGDELTPVVKGPVIFVDLFNFNIGHGMSMYDGAHRWAYEYRKRHPNAFIMNRLGFPDTVEGVMFVEDGWSVRTGMPTEYVYGDMLFGWIAHLVTNWMGDDAWLYRIAGQWREPVFLYDTNWVKGTVARKYIDATGQYKVDIDIHSEDQRGRRPIVGEATVILPSKTGGKPQVPPPDTPAPFAPEEAEVPTGESA
ncbi:MAG: MaoC family dehydratase N-terminal domain-containing protein [Chloroflexota bacterium]|nr:MaoC family dehydratase N-terminal domain-containing protein [Chloroflexota bacterium]